MKRILLLLSIFLITITIWAQAPQKLSYQAVIRDANNKLVINKQIGIIVTILQGNANGMETYKEKFNPNPQTNANGLVTIEIGNGTPISGTFAAINWSAGPYYIKTEIDPNGGTNYTISGTSQLLSVPYALSSKNIELPFSKSAYVDSAVVKIHNTRYFNVYHDYPRTIGIKGIGSTGLYGEGELFGVYGAVKKLSGANMTGVAIYGLAGSDNYSGKFVGGRFNVDSRLSIGDSGFEISYLGERRGTTSTTSHATLVENLGQSSNIRILCIEINTSGDTWYGGASYSSTPSEVSYSLKDNDLTIYVQPNSTYQGKPFRVVFMSVR